MIKTIEQLGKGAIPDPIDNRDYRISDIVGAVTVDWTTQFKLPEPPNYDQGNGDHCVSCAWSYYHWQLKNKVFSKRDLFCRIFLDYGASIRDGGVELVKNGQADNQEVNDPTPPTPQNMRSGAGTNASFRIDDKEYQSWVLPQGDIDGVAWGIKNYRGVVFGVYGSNQGWQDMYEPRPPQNGEAIWGHALYAMGYHIHNNQKCIIAKSSWCNSVTEHHIKENYFTALTGTMNAWTLIPMENPNMFPVKKVKVLMPGGKEAYGVAVITPNMVNITLAEDKEEWISYSKPDSYAVHSVNSDGSPDFSVDDTVDLR